MSHITDIWEPVLGKNGKVKFKPKDTIRGQKVIYAWCSRRKLYLKTKDGENVTVNIRGYEGDSGCPKCGNVGGSVQKYKVDKSQRDPIFFIADLKCPKCNTTYNLKVNIYGYEKDHL
ncbi:hypothetical protein KEJ45_06160 [Candidatus Bathyarchaeota archaeon]|nr:hypothetical protein [Candidatus Bathyarchaeota archaeon]